MSSYIEHPGFISALNQGVMKISLVGSGGCASCHKSLCMLRDTTHREVELPCDQHGFSVGDEVMVRMKPSSGYAAVALLYVIPFVLMMVVMIVALSFQVSEGIAGLCALLILIPYYGLLLLMRKYMKQQCQFNVVRR